MVAGRESRMYETNGRNPGQNADKRKRDPQTLQVKREIREQRKCSPEMERSVVETVAETVTGNGRRRWMYVVSVGR